MSVGDLPWAMTSARWRDNNPRGQQQCARVHHYSRQSGMVRATSGPLPANVRSVPPKRDGSIGSRGRGVLPLRGGEDSAHGR